MGALSSSVAQRLARALAAMGWEARRAGRRFLAQQGWWGVGLLAALVLVLAVCALERTQAAAARQAQQRFGQPDPTPAVPRSVDQPRGKVRMEQFEAVLLPHDDLPTQVQDLLNLAERERLSAAKGDYRPQIDGPGHFMRYRISLPVKGDAQAVHRFIESALRTHPALGLESVQFQRQRVDSPELEARIQWVVLARLPQGLDADTGTGGQQR